ncbi:MAG: type II toxin-antitoxin system prevent-host-death family antitoxin [Chloroflexota bacterium]|nr:type II toxin-antitoxin system Phd/YefM family antitoxin [Chloroflexota bacterium]
MYEYNSDEAKARLFDLIEAALKGEEVYIAKDGQRVISLVPVELPKAHRQFGSAKGLIVMADDFDAPLDEFSEYQNGQPR